ncbi:hypothetical protein V2J09_008765 [Rumex salicifolius]
MMSKADIRSSGGSWVGQLYQKFEAVCQEVDDIVSHDHVKMLENRAQLVGDNVKKFCSNVKDLIPSNFGAPLKHVDQSVSSVKSNSKLKDDDEECSSVANAKQFSQQIDVTDSSKSWPSCNKVSDDLHFKDSLENPSNKDPSCLSDIGLLTEGKQPLEISDPEFTDSHLFDLNFRSFTEEKQPTCDESELTCHRSSMINENSDLTKEKEDEPLSDTPELTFPDEDPCELSMLHIQNDKLEDKVSIDVSPAACAHSSGSEIHKKEDPLLDNVDEQSSDEMVNDNIHENSSGSEPIHISQIYLKEEKVCDSIQKLSPVSELQVDEEIVLDSLPKSCIDVSTENAPYSLPTSSTTPSNIETSAVRFISSVPYPLLHFSDPTETESQCTERNTFKDIVAEVGSVSTSAPASQTSEPYSCIISPKENVGSMNSPFFPFSTSQEFTEIPINSPRDSEGLKLNDMELPGKSELDESCVFVQNNRNHTVSFSMERHWKHKKKIRNPFTSRKKLEKEYKQLSLWYCDIDAEFNEVSGEKPIPSSNDNKHKAPSAQDLQESEWELEDLNRLPDRQQVQTHLPTKS